MPAGAKPLNHRCLAALSCKSLMRDTCSKHVVQVRYRVTTTSSPPCSPQRVNPIFVVIPSSQHAQGDRCIKCDCNRVLGPQSEGCKPHMVVITRHTYACRQADRQASDLRETAAQMGGRCHSRQEEHFTHFILACQLTYHQQACLESWGRSHTQATH